jgi:hypothetical protein
MYKERVLFERTMEDVKLASNTKLGVKKNIDDITAVICFFTIMLDEQK